MQEWYYVREGAQFGPLTRDELQEMYRDGDVAHGALIWKSGMIKWEPVEGCDCLWKEPALEGMTAVAVEEMPLGYASPDLVGMETAGFWIRAIALLIDWMVVLALNTGIHGAMYFLSVNGWIGWSGGDTLTALKFASQVMYFSLMESSPWQGTLGKLVFRLRVTDLDGTRITFGRAFFRHIGKWCSVGSFFVGFLMASFTQRNQALHDMMAKTLVVKR